MYSREVKVNNYKERIYISLEQISEKYINGFNYTFRWKIKNNDKLCLTVASKINLSAEKMFNVIENMLYYNPEDYEKIIYKYFQKQESIKA